ncbi:MAG: HIT family protein [Nanoarchaeota archaeon]
MSECIFCRIINGEIPCVKVYEDSNTFAFLDLNPVNKGHTLVVPKKHSETILDTDEKTLKNLMVTAKKISKAMMDGLKIKGFNIGINQFEEGGQVVPHLHIHIMPRLKNDGIKLWPQRKYESKEEMEETAEKIKSLL